MNLISCDNCGTVLNKDKLIFPKNIWVDDGASIDETKAMLYGDDWVAFIDCPVCQEPIPKTGE
jgi:hypothetical protein